MFITDNFLLNNKIAEDLYHNHGKDLPLIDYHNHLSPADIASDRVFSNLAGIWLSGDHYKWRLMRANGISEELCTGAADPWDKFKAFAETLPQAIGNPVYHWSHLELLRYFGIDKPINPANARYIWDTANSLINTREYSARNLLRKMKVETLCTTDDPADSLEFHATIREQGIETRVLPTFRPDRAMNISDSASFREYIKLLGDSSGTNIESFDHLLLALSKRADFFAKMGCKLSDHSLSSVPDLQYTYTEIREIFARVLSGKDASPVEARQFSLAVLTEMAAVYASHGWTMQLHLGALRSNNTRLLKKAGNDAGGDSIGDEPQAEGLAGFLDSLDRQNKLPSTILYNLNPSYNEVMASMAGNFGGCMTGKMQYGAAWWFLDNKAGIERQLETISNFGLLGRFIGMLTDSRSFLSFPRHEYFRRILANYLGSMAASGETDSDITSLSEIYSNISYYNAKNFFNF